MLASYAHWPLKRTCLLSYRPPLTAFPQVSTNGTKPHVGDVMSQAWFDDATSISERCWHQKLAFSSHFKPGNGNVGPKVNQSITFNEHVTNVHAFNLYVNI